MALPYRERMTLHPHSREWELNAIRVLDADANRSADTHLHVFPLPAEWGIDLYLKDESVHPTGSLKHRLARSLILYGLVNGRIHEGTTLIEASSGSTAVSEAYFADMIGLDFVTVVPRIDERREDPLHRVLRRPLPLRRRPDRDLRRGRAPRLGVRRLLPRPVHARRARHRLARQQQHRRERVRAARARTLSDPLLDRRRGRHRRHERNLRPLRALSPPPHPRGRRGS